MAIAKCVSSLLKILLSLTILNGVSASDVKVIATKNFTDVLEGEWMLEFYAPWCPACKQFAVTWESFASWAAGKDVTVAKVDVTTETMLSGQFMVTHLPTIFHIIDGEVRRYYEDRSLEQLESYIDDKLWRNEEPLPWWRSPTASHMKGVGMIFWLSEKAKEFQDLLEKDYQLPTYAVFIVIAVATIVVGLTLGGLTVCVIEVCMRLCSGSKSSPKAKEQDSPEKHKEVKPTEAPASKGGEKDGSNPRKRKKDKKQGSGTEDKGQSS